MSAPLSTVEESERQTDFGEWLQAAFEDGLVTLEIAWRNEGDRWFCLAEEFDITGMGPTPSDAYVDMLALLGVYLYSHFSDGSSFRDALRPIPRRLKLEIRRDVWLAPITRLLPKRPSNLERTVVVLPEQLAPQHAVC